MAKLAARPRVPGLLAFEGDEPVGWIAIAPRTELARIEASRATPRVDHEDVWVIPCITVRRTARGRGIATALIRAAVAYARENGAPAVEAYPRARGRIATRGIQLRRVVAGSRTIWNPARRNIASVPK